MERYIGLDAHASSCTLAVVGPSGKRLGSHVVETNARALTRGAQGDPPQPARVSRGRDAVGVAVRGARAARGGAGRDGGSQEPGPGERQARRVCAGGAASDRGAGEGGAQGAGHLWAVGPAGAGVRVRDARRGAGEEPSEERASLAGRGPWGRELGVREAGPGAGSKAGV